MEDQVFHTDDDEGKWNTVSHKKKSDSDKKKKRFQNYKDKKNFFKKRDYTKKGEQTDTQSGEQTNIQTKKSQQENQVTV